MVEQIGEQASAIEQGTAAVRQAAGDLKEQGRSRFRETLDERTTQVGEEAHKLARALRQSGEQLRGEGDDGQAVRLTDSAAERMEQLATYLQGASGDDLLRRAEGMARRRPWVTAGLGLAAGVAASRFLKASAERRYGESSRQTPGAPSAGAYEAAPAGRTAAVAHEAPATEAYASSR